ncbi:type II secretion system protein GspG [Desulfobulbus alkaliphilus]|uniref:type II secretion system protein GspG n=1 Tax=Desulfobulbus alkaliphilus TaxID=869814 RepID=UPI001964AE55|nr:type II secretion system protein GspG [Desulfobulbus alkaliphilus]MBM9536582.1 type II secretion system protein GspG [Desulfobulbus alkaliphilus]
MGNISLAVLVLAGTLLVFTDAPERIRALIDDSIHTGQQLATAGDLRSISTMLDIQYVKQGRYPAEERFEAWMAATFKENHAGDLARDHWGNPYVYTVIDQGRGYILRSAGADGLLGTEDDMWVTGP